MSRVEPTEIEKYFDFFKNLSHDCIVIITFSVMILSYLILSVSDAPSIQKNIASYAYPWFVFSPAFLLEF